MTEFDVAKLELQKGKCYIILLDPNVFDFEQLVLMEFPEEFNSIPAIFIPCRPEPGKALKDSIHHVEGSIEEMESWIKILKFAAGGRS